MTHSATITLKQLPAIVYQSLWQSVYDLITLIKNSPYYIRHPLLIRVELIMGCFYTLLYPTKKNEYEKKKTCKSLHELNYGEITYGTFQRALKHIPIDANSLFMDLGCGKGKLVFFAAIKHKIQSIGVDLIQTYITTAQTIAKQKHIKHTQFIKDDFLNTSLQHATIILCTCTCFGKTTMTKLTDQLNTVQKGTHVISISTPIKSPLFKQTMSFKGWATWGQTIVYIQRKKA